MKLFITLFLFSSLLFSNNFTKENHKEICKNTISKAQSHNKKMNKSKIEELKLEAYKNKIRLHCGSLVSKSKYI